MTKRLSLQEYAAATGVSEVTVRRRLKKGELTGEQEQTPQGYRWIIITEDQELSGETPDEQASSQAGVPRVIDLLEQQVTFLRDQLQVREREVERLHIIISQQATALQALPATTTTPEWEEGRQPAPEETVEQRPWWRRALGLS